MLRKAIFTLILLVSGLSGLSSNVPAAHAGWNAESILEDFQESVEEQSGEKIEKGAKKIEIPSFTKNGQEGAETILKTLQRFMDFFKLIVTPMAILFATVMGYRMVSAGDESEEVYGQAKNFMRYAIEGLIVIFLADELVTALVGTEGEIFRNGTAGVKVAAGSAINLAEGIYGLVRTLIASIAVLMIILAGFRYVWGAYDEDQLGKAKNQIKWSLVGLFVIGISEFTVKRILFQDSARLGIDEAKTLIVQLTNFVASSLGTLSFIFMIYAGLLYVAGVQNEENTSKAKNIIYGALLGIVVALSAYAITNTFITLEPNN